MVRSGFERLLDLDAVGALGVAPVPRVAGCAPADPLARPRDAHRYPRAGRRVRDRRSNALLERRRRQAADEDPATPEAVKGYGSGEAPGDHHGEPGEAPGTDVGGGYVPGAERITGVVPAHAPPGAGTLGAEPERGPLGLLVGMRLHAPAVRSDRDEVRLRAVVGEPLDELVVGSRLGLAERRMRHLRVDHTGELTTRAEA